MVVIYVRADTGPLRSMISVPLVLRIEYLLSQYEGA